MKWYNQKPFLGTPVNRDLSISKGLILSTLMNEGYGRTVQDLSGNNNKGTITNAIWTPGKFGRCLSFDGSGDYVSFGDINETENINSLTLSVWIKPSAVMTAHYVFTKRAAASDGSWQILIFTNSRIYFRVETSDGQFNAASGSTPITNTTKWYHIVAVYNGNSIYYYVDGLLDIVPVSASGTINNTNDAVRLGAGSTPANYNGLIDNVNIWNRALSTSEIAQLYREPFHMYDTTPTEIWSKVRAGGNILTPYYYKHLLAG